MITTVTLNPAVDRTVRVPKLELHDSNRITLIETDAGGKGINCSRVLKELGADTTALAFLGGKSGDFVRAVLEREGVELDIIETSKPTRENIAVEEDAAVPPTTLNERGGPVEHAELVSLLERAKDLSRSSSYVVFGGSVPVGVNQDVYFALIQIATAGGARAVLDADGEPLLQGLKARPYMIKPNLVEAERLVGCGFGSRGDVARAALDLAERHAVELVIISLGRQGAICSYGGAIYDASAPDIKADSTIGSGDSMIAGVLFALEQDMGIEDALRWGSAAGAATAMSNGADIGRREDIDALLGQIKVTHIEAAS